MPEGRETTRNDDALCPRQGSCIRDVLDAGEGREAVAYGTKGAN